MKNFIKPILRFRFYVLHGSIDCYFYYKNPNSKHNIDLYRNNKNSKNIVHCYFRSSCSDMPMIYRIRDNNATIMYK